MAKKAEIQFRVRKVAITDIDAEVTSIGDALNMVLLHVFYGDETFGFFGNSDMPAYINLLMMTGCKTLKELVGKKVNLLEHRRLRTDGIWTEWDYIAVGKSNKYTHFFGNDERIYTCREMCSLTKEMESSQ
ncbi:MAG: hypothetical protein LBL91_00385 [Lachnospiraceae bacterium]|nr:hypothetical protein [Lachnospiraceae bacterium]